MHRDRHHLVLASTNIEILFAVGSGRHRRRRHLVQNLNHILLVTAADASATQVLPPPRARLLKQLIGRLDELLELDRVGVRDAGEMGVQRVLLVRVPKF